MEICDSTHDWWRIKRQKSALLPSLGLKIKRKVLNSELLMKENSSEAVRAEAVTCTVLAGGFPAACKGQRAQR